jgi:hypothetical protein
VIPEDEDQCQASEKVDSVIAFSRHGGGLLNGFEVGASGGTKGCTPLIGGAQGAGNRRQLQSVGITECLKHCQGTTACLKARQPHDL